MKVGFVSIVGRPNVGKSTLLNRILQYPLSITSSTPQTTRDQIKGIYNDKDSQIIFIDTPGIHKPKQLLGESLNKNSFDSLKDIDWVLFLQPSDELIGPGDRFVIDLIKNTKTKTAVITKLDKSNPEDAKKRAEELKELGFDEVIGTSVEMNNSIDSMIAYIKSKLPEGPLLYDPEEFATVSMRFIAKEIVRESALKFVSEELPHSIGVVVESFIEPTEEDSRYVLEAVIYIERDSQKGILVGKDGSMIKKIGTAARKKLEELWDAKVYIGIKVKVKKNWTSNADEIKKMGY